MPPLESPFSFAGAALPFRRRKEHFPLTKKGSARPKAGGHKTGSSHSGPPLWLFLYPIPLCVNMEGNRPADRKLLRCFMKLLFIIGDAAVGKMTVGQELMKITDLRLFHNHMTIEPVIEIFGRYDGKTISEIRDTIFRNYAASDNYGMIFTLMMDFDLPSEWEYLEHIKGIFEPYGTDFYYVELIAPQEIRRKRNISENRLKNKASKREIETSNQRLINDDKNHRCVSYGGEIPFDNYLRIDHSDMEPEKAARLIQETFHL